MTDTPPMPRHSTHPARARAFTISGYAMFLLIAFLAVSIGHAIWAATQPGWTNSKWLPYLLLYVVVPLVLAVGVTLTAYFLTRKSNLAANITLGTILLLMIGGRVALVTGVLPKNFTFKGALSPVAASASAPPPTQGVAPEEPGGGDNPAARTPSSRSGARSNSSAAGVAGGDPNLPTALPAQSTIPETPSTPAFKDVASWIALKEPRSADVLNALAVELDGSVEEVLDKAGLCVDSLAKIGRASNRTLDERIALADAGKQLAEALADRLFRLNDEAARSLKGSRAAVSAHNFVFHSAAGARSIAARQYADFFSAVSQQSALLRNNQSKWSLNRDGSIDAKDGKLRVDLNAPTFTIDVFLKREKDFKAQLEGR